MIHQKNKTVHNECFNVFYPHGALMCFEYYITGVNWIILETTVTH